MLKEEEKERLEKEMLKEAEKAKVVKALVGYAEANTLLLTAPRIGRTKIGELME